MTPSKLFKDCQAFEVFNDAKGHQSTPEEMGPCDGEPLTTVFPSKMDGKVRAVCEAHAERLVALGVLQKAWQVTG